MKNVSITLVVTLLLAILLGACKKDDGTGLEEIGNLRKPDVGINIRSVDGSSRPLTNRGMANLEAPRGRARQPTSVGQLVAEVARVDNNEVVYSVENYSDLPELIELPTGIYVFRVFNDDFPSNAPSFDFPYYWAQSLPFTIDRGQTKSIESITATASNTRIRVIYSDDIQQQFSSYRVTITSSNGEVLVYDENRQDWGYYTSGEELAVNGVFELTTQDGQIISKTLTYVIPIEMVLPGAGYELTFDTGLNEGEIAFEAALDDTWTTSNIDINDIQPGDPIDEVIFQETNLKITSIPNNSFLSLPSALTQRDVLVVTESTRNISFFGDFYASTNRFERGTFFGTSSGINPQLRISLSEFLDGTPIYITVVGRFTDGEEVESKVGFLPKSADRPEPGLVLVNSPVTPSILNITTDPQLFQDDAVKFNLTRATNSVTGIYFRSNSGVNESIEANNLTFDYNFEFGGDGGMMEYFINAKPNSVSPDEDGNFRHILILGDLDESDVYLNDRGNDGVEIGTTNFSFIGVPLFKIYRSESSTFDEENSILISDWTSKRRIMDLNPLPVGTTVYYHVKAATNYNGDVQSNVITKPFTK